MEYVCNLVIDKISFNAVIKIISTSDSTWGIYISISSKTSTALL